MKREFRSLVYVFALGAAMTAASLGGAAGCGSGSGGGGGGGTTASDEAVTGSAASTLAGLAELAATDDTEALILRSEQTGLKAQEASCIDSGGSVSCDCAVSGSFSVDSDSISFDDCSFEAGQSISGSMTFTDDGTNLAVTFDDVTFTDDDCGSFTINGTSAVTPLEDGSADIDMDVDIDTGSGTISLDCSFNSNDTCPEVASGCGFSSAEACEGDEYGSLACE